MPKKEIKDRIRSFKETAAKNEEEVGVLNVLAPPASSKDAALLSQERIKRSVSMYTREKAFDLTLENGPFSTSYTCDGVHSLITNKKGYAAAFNTHQLVPSFETDVGDKIYDACWLHNENFFALAQERALYIYNGNGAEQHAVRDVVSPRRMEFLPYHFLLAISSNTGKLKYLDTSIGSVIADIFVGDKESAAIRANPTTGVVYLGSSRGVVSLWAPAQKDYLMKISCLGTPIAGIEIDRTGSTLVTAGVDGRITTFDIRQTYQPLTNIKLDMSICTTSLSQQNLLAVGGCGRLKILEDYEKLYMTEAIGGEVESVDFCPFEDILAVGHKRGVKCVIVPGSGDPRYDATEITPFMSKKQRQSLEVRRLLEKIPYDLISHESTIGTVAKESKVTIPGTRGRYYNTREDNALSRFRTEQ